MPGSDRLDRRRHDNGSEASPASGGGRPIPSRVLHDPRWQRPVEELPEERVTAMIKDAIATLVSGKSLSMDQAEAAMTEIMNGEVTPAQFGAFVTALRIKG